MFIVFIHLIPIKLKQCKILSLRRLFSSAPFKKKKKKTFQMSFSLYVLLTCLNLGTLPLYYDLFWYNTPLSSFLFCLTTSDYYIYWLLFKLAIFIYSIPFIYFELLVILQKISSFNFLVSENLICFNNLFI